MIRHTPAPAATPFSDRALPYLLTALAFFVSYSSLADVAARSGLGASQAAIWPVIVDGLIVAANRDVLRTGRRYAWTLFGCASAVSIAGNVADAVLPDGPMPVYVAAVVAAIPPLALLAVTHLAVRAGSVTRAATPALSLASLQVTHRDAAQSAPDAQTSSAPVVAPHRPALDVIVASGDAADLARDADSGAIDEHDATPDAGDETHLDPVAEARRLFSTTLLSNYKIAEMVGKSDAFVRRNTGDLTRPDAPVVVPI
ncbi:DUF2637 domain-containing protein [Rhodococcus maanshanensis]|uniref:DUF2637 domain-containing protein n=1 Tax=Rhodococcus maanshanensis TaxID=183556 RepID=UPI0022B43CA2|nr:DUF2637 domain-containing protein [Rhodococcus maanshanensis]MCZ4558002.1 DUF2637 domain-containing protein [Rhodococcus maanshanensis]